MENFSVSALVGNMLFSCFFSDSTFCADTQGKDTTFTEEHAHANYELLYVQKGEGIQFIHNVANAYTQDAVFLFAPFTPHASVCRAADGEKRISLRFAVQHNDCFAAEGEQMLPLEWLQENGFFAFTAEPRMRALFEVLEDSVNKRQLLATGGLMSAVLGCVLDRISRSACTDALLQKNYLADDSLERRFLIDQFFDQLVNRNSTMEELCNRVHLSPAQLNRVIKEMFGVTFKQKLIQVRLSYIKYFLKYSDLSVSDIAQRNGFADVANFSLFFKKHLGESPTQFRLREKNTPN